VTIYHYPILEYLQKLWLTNKLIELYFTGYIVEQIQTLIFDPIISTSKVQRLLPDKFRRRRRFSVSVGQTSR